MLNLVQRYNGIFEVGLKLEREKERTYELRAYSRQVGEGYKNEYEMTLGQLEVEKEKQSYQEFFWKIFQLLFVAIFDKSEVTVPIWLSFEYRYNVLITMFGRKEEVGMLDLIRIFTSKVNKNNFAEKILEAIIAIANFVREIKQKENENNIFALAERRAKIEKVSNLMFEVTGAQTRKMKMVCEDKDIGCYKFGLDLPAKVAERTRFDGIVLHSEKEERALCIFGTEKLSELFEGRYSKSLKNFLEGKKEFVAVLSESLKRKIVELRKNIYRMGLELDAELKYLDVQKRLRDLVIGRHVLSLREVLSLACFAQFLNNDNNANVLSVVGRYKPILAMDLVYEQEPKVQVKFEFEVLA